MKGLVFPIPSLADPIVRLQARLHLSQADADLLTLALLPEISAGYARILAFLNDHMQRDYLTVDTATRILATNRTERMSILGRLLPEAPLLSNKLITLDWSEAASGPLSAQRVLLSRATVLELLRPLTARPQEGTADPAVLPFPGGDVPDEDAG